MGMSIVGNVGLGSLGDKIGLRQIYIIGLTLITATFCWLFYAKELWMFYLFAIFFGCAFGAMSVSQAPLIAWLFGLRSVSSILGVLQVGVSIGSALGPFITGYIFDVTGGYRAAFIVCAIIAAIGILLTLSLRPIKVLQQSHNPEFSKSKLGQ